MQTALEPVARPAAAARPYRDDATLAEALDRILHRGVALEGVLTIGLADIDLLYLDLRLLLGSVDTIWPDGVPATAPIRPTSPSPSSPPAARPAPAAPPPAAAREPAARDAARAREDGGRAGLPAVAEERREVDESSTAHGLVRLVLTVVRLLHDVLERQAVRRMEAGQLSEAQIDRLGAALFAQADEIARLQRRFGFSDKDLSLDLALPYGTA